MKFKHAFLLFLVAVSSSLLAACGGSSTPPDVSDRPDSPPPIPQGERTFYIAPGGDDLAAGTESAPFATLPHAVSIAEPGDVIVMRAGTYDYDSRIDINRSGMRTNPIALVNYPGEIPLLDFSEQQELAGEDGIRLNADYWHIAGIHLRGAGGNGFRIHGSYNVLERSVAYENRLTGIHLEDGAYNLIKNNDSYRNFNLRKRVGNMSDGFAAKYEALGPGNNFYGNRAWENSDDGFDLWMASSMVVLQNNWSFSNGDESIWQEQIEAEGRGFEGMGNGFKLGGDYVAGDHLVLRNMAFDNHGKGFDHNNNTGALSLVHNTGYNNGITHNGRNFDIRNPPQNGGQHRFFNNLNGPSPQPALIAEGSLMLGNSWQQTTEVTSGLFSSVATAQARSPRKPDGSLPDINLFVPRSGSFLVDSGELIDVASFGDQAFAGEAPDIGAREYRAGKQRP